MMGRRSKKKWPMTDFEKWRRPQNPKWMSPSERADSISPQGSAKACENINAGKFKFEKEFMEKIQYEVWPNGQKCPKPELTLKRKMLILKLILFIYFEYFLN